MPSFSNPSNVQLVSIAMRCCKEFVSAKQSVVTRKSERKIALRME